MAVLTSQLVRAAEFIYTKLLAQYLAESQYAESWGHCALLMTLGPSI